MHQEEEEEQLVELVVVSARGVIAVEIVDEGEVVEGLVEAQTRTRRKNGSRLRNLDGS
jgi:ribosomal protein L14